MSAIIQPYKSKFVIFGSGYNDTRNDSGDGMVTFLWKCDYAAFDNTGRYLWVVTKSGEPEDRKIRKIDTTTWMEVPHAFENIDVYNETVTGMLAYVENDNSNLGVLVISATQLVVFDLTTDAVLCTVNGNLWNMTTDYALRATRVGDVIRVIGTTMDESYYTAPFATINTSTLAYALNNQSGGYTISSFYNDTDITLANRSYGTRQFLWGARINAVGDLTQLWGDPSEITPNTKLDSFASNDYLFFPTKIGDVWQYGKYPIPPDIITPSPIATFGIRANTIATPPAYTRGRTWASFRTTDNALVVTDMVNAGILYTGDAPSLTPVAMGDPLIVCAGSDGYTYLARYK